MSIDVKQLKEFVALTEKALERINGQDELVKSIQKQLNDLESKLLDVVSDRNNALPVIRNNGIGFQQESEAKEFLGFVSAIFNQSQKDLNTAVAEDGGFLVQPEYRNNLMSIIEAHGIARQNCSVFTMNSNELVMPKLTGGVQVYWIGEKQTIPQTQPDFGEFKMSVKKLAALVPMTSEFLEDASIEIANLLLTLFGQAIAKEEDRIVFQGRVLGADPFNGVLHNPGTTQHVLPANSDAFTDITADDLEEVVSKQSSTLTGNARWYMHRTIFSIIRKLKYGGSSDGEYIYAQPTADSVPTIWGYPVTLVETMVPSSASGASTPFIFFGDLSNYYIGDRRRMQLARSEHVGFANDKVFLRITQREALEYALPETGIAVITSS